MRKAQYKTETIEVVAFTGETSHQVMLTLKTGYGIHHLEVQTEKPATDRFCALLEEQVSDMLSEDGVLMTIFALTTDSGIDGIESVIDRTVS